ncbi:MAG: CARDB domain-containing protein, partial [Candidatus Kariarchaeaceae archaeon]
AISEVDQSPSKIEEFSNFRLEINIINNGTIPSSNFRATVSFNQSIEEAIEISYLEVNETIIFTFDQFRWIGTTQFELEIAVDTDDRVSEISEADNKIIYKIVVNTNYRFRVILGAVAGLILIILSKRFFKRVQNTRNRNHIHYDVIV